MLSPSSLLRIRWVILLSLVGLLVAFAPEPIDTAAVTAFQQTKELTAPSARGPDLDQHVSRKKPLTHKDAEAAYRRVAARRPLDPQPWQQLGDLYAAWGRPDDALHAYNQAVLRSDDAAALDRSLAQLYSILGDSRKSVRHWVDYLARRPNDRTARLAVIRSAVRLADWDRARAELEHLLAGDSTDPVVHAWFGLLFNGLDPMTGTTHLQYAADDPATATFLQPVLVAERRSAANDDPAYRSALLGVSLLDLDASSLCQLSELDCGQPGQAVEEHRKAIATLALRSLLAAVYYNPAYAEAYAYLGQAFDELDRSDWAEASLRYAVKLAPHSPVVQTLTGFYWDRRGAYALARHYYEIAYKQDQDNATLCLEIAATYAAEAKYTAAEIWLRFAAEIAPDDPQVWRMLTYYYVELGIGVEESGLSAATRLLELAPNDARAHDLMGWAYFLTGKDARARDSLDQALALDPTLASAHYHLGRLNARQDRHAEASQSYRWAAEYDVGGHLAAELDRAWDNLPLAYRDEP